MKHDRPQTFRMRLRAETSEAHETLDDLVSRFDLTSRSGLTCYFTMQDMALSRLEGGTPFCAEMIDDLARRCRHDLETLGIAPAKDTPSLAMPVEPTALDYVLVGSRLGTTVLKKRWASAPDTVNQTVCAYFTAPTYIDKWTELCAQFARMSAFDVTADKVIHDANRLFDFYIECAQQAQDTYGAADA